MVSFTIKLPPVTKKNSQQILWNKSTNRPFVMPSKQFKEYEANSMWFIPKVKNKVNEPCNVKCLFYMPTHRRVDLTNLLEAVDDIMVKAGLLEDDNSTIIVGHDGSRVLYDKENPRTEVTIERMEECNENF